MEEKEFLSIIIPSFITIVGFIITSMNNKKELSRNIQEFKTEQQINDFRGLQRNVIICLDLLCKHIAKLDIDVPEFINLRESIHTEVICFGSEDAVKIVSYIQSILYTCKDDKKIISHDFLIAAYVLLIMQIKYDTTGIKTSPREWYVGTYTTEKMLETGFFERSIDAINEIVEELNLNKFLKINK